MRYYRKLAKPLMGLGLIGFVGQFLWVCCGAIAADVSVLSEHCHEDVQIASQQHHINTSVMDNEPHCVEHKKTSQTQVCCYHAGTDQTLISQQSEKNTLKVDFVEVPIGLVPLLPRNIAVMESPPAPESARSRSSPPIYLANCTFLE